MTPRQAQRRYLGLTSLRWVCSGLVMPVQMLLFTARGLDLATIGLLVALFSSLIIVLELPTGGLADLLGRRRTMLLAEAVRVVALVGMAFAQVGWHFAGAIALFAASRALGSGPLEAWYVDSVRGADPDASLRVGIARGWTVEALGLGLAAIVGGAAPQWFDLAGDGPLVPISVPVLGAAALGVLSLVAHAVLMTEPARPVGPAGVKALLLAVPGQMRYGIRLVSRDRVLRLLIARAAAIGLAVFTLEILAPLQFAAFLGGPEAAAAAYGPLVAAAFVGTAVGAAGAPLLCRLGRAPGPGRPLAVAAGCTVLAAVAFGLIGLAAAGSGGFGLAVVGFLVAYLVSGVPGPLIAEALHQRVAAVGRATLISIAALALQLGGLIGALGAVRLADRVGYPYGWLVGGLALLLAAGLTMAARAGDRSAGPARTVGQPAATADRSEPEPEREPALVAYPAEPAPGQAEPVVGPRPASGPTVSWPVGRSRSDCPIPRMRPKGDCASRADGRS